MFNAFHCNFRLALKQSNSFTNFEIGDYFHYIDAEHGGCTTRYYYCEILEIFYQDSDITLYNMWYDSARYKFQNKLDYNNLLNRCPLGDYDKAYPNDLMIECGLGGHCSIASDRIITTSEKIIDT